MAYDSARGVTVLVGGFDGSRRGDTWEWDGNTWSLRTTDDPLPRINHAMTYDTVRHVTLLFAGMDDEGPQVWAWDGDAWSLLATGGPSYRFDHALTFDDARGVAVMFGGYDGAGWNGETWEFDGTTWFLRATSGPTARERHALSYDGARGRSLLFGGIDENGCRGDTWEWDGVNWVLTAIVGPAPRASHAMSYDQLRGETVLFGGSICHQWRSNETWTYSHVECVGQERIGKADCRSRQGESLLKVVLVGGLEGDFFLVGLSTGPTASGTIDARGKGKAKFKNRPAGDGGVATAMWGCGATAGKDYACP